MKNIPGVTVSIGKHRSTFCLDFEVYKKLRIAKAQVLLDFYLMNKDMGFK